jgi:hypothetical protein
MNGDLLREPKTKELISRIRLRSAGAPGREAQSIIVLLLLVGIVKLVDFLLAFIFLQPLPITIALFFAMTLGPKIASELFPWDIVEQERSIDKGESLELILESLRDRIVRPHQGPGVPQEVSTA